MIFLITIIVISIGLLSGCTENSQQNGNNQQNGNSTVEQDTDSDGYTDDIDAFPLDDNLHEKAPFNELNSLNYNITLEPGSGQGPHSTPNITSEWKYIVCNWYVTDPQLTEEQAERVILEITNPTTTPVIRYYNNDSNSHELKFTINNDNLGEWKFEFGNLMIEGLDISPVTVTIHIELYKIR